MLLLFYRLPLWFVILGTAVVIVISGKIKANLYRKSINKINFVAYIGLFLSLALIFSATIIRNPSNIYEIQLIPLQSLIHAQTQPEMYRTMLMNIVLFVPMGITVTFINFRRFSVKKHFLVTVLSSLILSISIELYQYANGIGLFQTDDVICNVLGVLIGFSTYPLSNYFLKSFLKSKYFD